MGDNTDLESLPKGGGKEISQFSWKGLTVTVKDSKTQESLDILKNVEGSARPGIHIPFLIFVLKTYLTSPLLAPPSRQVLTPGLGKNR